MYTVTAARHVPQLKITGSVMHAQGWVHNQGLKGNTLVSGSRTVEISSLLDVGTVEVWLSSSASEIAGPSACIRGAVTNGDPRTLSFARQLDLSSSSTMDDRRQRQLAITLEAPGGQQKIPQPQLLIRFKQQCPYHHHLKFLAGHETSSVNRGLTFSCPDQLEVGGQCSQVGGLGALGGKGGCSCTAPQMQQGWMPCWPVKSAQCKHWQTCKLHTKSCKGPTMPVNHAPISPHRGPHTCMGSLACRQSSVSCAHMWQGCDTEYEADWHVGSQYWAVFCMHLNPRSKPGQRSDAVEVGRRHQLANLR